MEENGNQVSSTGSGLSVLLLTVFQSLKKYLYLPGPSQFYLQILSKTQLCLYNLKIQIPIPVKCYYLKYMIIQEMKPNCNGGICLLFGLLLILWFLGLTRVPYPVMSSRELIKFLSAS
jgi:hypothetical protein